MNRLIRFGRQAGLALCACALVLSGGAYAANATSQQVANPTGGVLANGSDGLRVTWGSNSQFQVRLSNADQVYNANATPTAGTLYNGVYLRVDRGTNPSTRVYTNANNAAGNPFTLFNQVSQSGLSGTGTAASPYEVTTVLQPSVAADSAIRVTIVDRYITPQAWFTRRVSLSGMPATGATIKFYQNVDTYLQGGDKYKGPYKDKSADGLKSIETPDDRTIVFKLNQPFADFDYLATFSQTAPVPAAKDDGAKYVQHIVSSGPYKFQSYEEGRSATLVRNTNWDQKTDPVRKALPDKITVQFKVNPVTIDNNLLADKITADIAGTGVQPQTQPRVLSGKYAKQTDNSYAGATSYIALNVNVAPFDNVHCRKAVNWAIDKQSILDAIGGSPKGDVATTLLPPSVNGYTKFDEYPSAGHKGDAAKAKEELKLCGKPNGFSTTLTARSDRPAEIAQATAIQNSLKSVGINVDIKQFPSGKYFANFAGVPSYVHQHKLGMLSMAWGADWPTGYGFLDQIVDGAAIKPSGGNNLMELNDPKINAALKAAIANTDAAARTKAWGDIDKMVMDNGSVVPLVYRKNLLFRSASATNVTVTQAYLGMYDYLLLSSSK